MKRKIGKLTVPLARPEDLIVLKGIARRQQDLLDIERLLEIYPDLDFAYVRRWLNHFASELEMSVIYTDVDALITRTSSTRRRKNPKNPKNS